MFFYLSLTGFFKFLKLMPLILFQFRIPNTEVPVGILKKYERFQ